MRGASGCRCPAGGAAELVAIYPALSLLAAAAVILLECRVLRTGIFRDAAYWVAMGISYVFMVPVDGWLTKLSAPIVIYRAGDVSEWRPVWDILAEEYVYAFALLTLVIALWEWAGRDGVTSG